MPINRRNDIFSEYQGQPNNRSYQGQPNNRSYQGQPNNRSYQGQPNNRSYEHMHNAGGFYNIQYTNNMPPYAYQRRKTRVYYNAAPRTTTYSFVNPYDNTTEIFISSDGGRRTTRYKKFHHRKFVLSRRFKDTIFYIVEWPIRLLRKLNKCFKKHIFKNSDREHVKCTSKLHNI